MFFVTINLRKQVKCKSEAIQDPGHSGLSSGASVVVVVVVVGAVVGKGCLNGGVFRFGGEGELNRFPKPNAGAKTGNKDVATEATSGPLLLLLLLLLLFPSLLRAGFLAGFCGLGGGALPPPPRIEPSAGAKTGNSAAAVEPASEFPVAAFNNVPKT